jgi:hypothetical protein
MLRRACALTILATAALLAQAPGNAELSQVQFVYLLPMGGGLDQYVANWLVRENVYQVVTDPKKADTIVTDSIGGTFEQKLNELYPPPAPPEPKEEEKKDDKPGDVTLKGETGRPPSTFTRGRGNVYLVDLKSRRVLWSVYERPKSFQPDELDKTAQRVVRHLKKSITGK